MDTIYILKAIHKVSSQAQPFSRFVHAFKTEEEALALKGAWHDWEQTLSRWNYIDACPVGNIGHAYKSKCAEIQQRQVEDADFEILAINTEAAQEQVYVENWMKNHEVQPELMDWFNK